MSELWLIHAGILHSLGRHTFNPSCFGYGSFNLRLSSTHTRSWGSTHLDAWWSRALEAGLLEHVLELIECGRSQHPKYHGLKRACKPATRKPNEFRPQTRNHRHIIPKNSRSKGSKNKLYPYQRVVPSVKNDGPSQSRHDLKTLTFVTPLLSKT